MTSKSTTTLFYFFFYLSRPILGIDGSSARQSEIVAPIRRREEMGHDLRPGMSAYLISMISAIKRALGHVTAIERTPFFSFFFWARQERVRAKETPPYYLRKLKTYLDPKASRSSKKRKMVGNATSTQVLRDLEISLRTNHIE